MIYRIEHSTRYLFSQPVFLEPHILRLTPRSDACQQVLSHELRIEPRPAGQAQGVDVEGGPFVQTWFDGLLECLDIHMRAEVQTKRDNPYDFLLLPPAEKLPMNLSLESAALRSALAPYLQPWSKNGQQDGVTELAAHLMEPGGTVMDFLDRLNRYLFAKVKKIHRPEAGLQLPSWTLTLGRGACRDLALVFMEVCRAAGIPARFTSGYHEGDPDEPEAELHAWAEAYVPGGGWRGYDPTHGLAVADRHVALTSAATPEATTPLAGSFRGTGAVSRMETRVRMEML